MNKVVLFSAGAALVASSTAFSDVFGIRGQETLRYYESDGNTITDIDGAAYAVLDIYIDFSAANTEGYDNEDSVLLNLFNVNISTDDFDQFQQRDIAGGSWKPSFSFDMPDVSNPNIDSFVTIGGGVGDEASTNQTSLDPSFGAGNNSDIFNPDIGWYATPSADQGGVDINLQVWIGRFVATGDEALAGANFDINCEIGYNYGDGTGAFFSESGGNFVFFPDDGDGRTDPVPGGSGLALLALGGAGMRRSRRR